MVQATNVVRRRNLHESSQEHSNDSKSKEVGKSPVEELKSRESFKLKRRLIRLVKNCAKIYLFLNVAGCFLIYAWPEFMSHMIFQTFIHIPFKNLSDPLAFGVERAYSFKLDHDDVQLGAWHIMPRGLDIKPSSSLEDHFHVNIPSHHDGGEPPIVILYLHGNTNDRSTGHRLELYDVLRSLDYHVIAVDYRGYGDSTGYPTEVDVVRDALFTYEYIQKTIPWATIYVWGHSLGTGITSSMARMLTEKGNPAKGIILEAPFFNIVEEVEFHPFTWLFSPNKILIHIIQEALQHLELQFRSDIHLTKVSSKIMILHAEDDFVIPVFQADKLYEAVANKGIAHNLTYHRISFFNWCGHRNIYSAPNITQIIREFVY